MLALWLVFNALEIIPYQNRLHAWLFDAYQVLAPRPRISAPVVIVDVDEASLARYGQWPWPRNLLALLLVRIERMNPAAIGLDVIMPEPDRSSPCQVARYIPKADEQLIRQVCSLPSNDALLADALGGGPTVLGVAGLDYASAGSARAPPMRAIGGDPARFLRHFPGVLANLDELENAAQGHAVLSVDVEDGVVRRVPLAAHVGQAVVPSLSLEMLRLAVGGGSFTIKSAPDRIAAVAVGELAIPTQEDGSVWVHYGHHDAGRFVSAAKILDGGIDAGELSGKLVLIGISGLGLVDFPSTPLGERLPGVEIHAQLLESLFDQTTLLRPGWAKWPESLLMALLGLAIIGVVARADPLYAVPMALMAAASPIAVGFAFYTGKYWLLDGATPALACLVVLGAMLAEALIRASAQRKALEEVLQAQRHAAAKLAGEMEAAGRIQMGILPDAQKMLGGETRLDLAARMEPAKAVGGDFYDFFKLDDDRVFFIVGDVCGKGVPASLFMAISKTLFKSLALRGDRNLAKLAAQANLEISRDNSEMLFVTAFLGILDLNTGALQYCNAGHEKPLAVRANGEPLALESMGGPAFCIVEDYGYTVANYGLAVGEFICLVSDGITEAYNPDKSVFGTERLSQALSSAATAESAEALVQSVCEKVRGFSAGAEQSDDLTILTVRWLGA